MARRGGSANGIAREAEGIDAWKIQHVEKAVKRLCVKPYSVRNLPLRTGCLRDEKDRELGSGT